MLVDKKLTESTLTEEKLLETALSVPMQTVKWRSLNDLGIEVVVRRDDLIHPYLSGNKFYKLFFNIKHASELGVNKVLSFGGAYSNHLYALAAAGHLYGMETIGVVRGERPEKLSPTLEDAQRWGMTLYFMDRERYRRKQEQDVLDGLKSELGGFYTVPEGGSNRLGVKGCRVLGQAIEQQLQGDYQAVCVACGTGSTLAGLSQGLPKDKKAYGFSVLKGQGSMADEISAAVYDLKCEKRNEKRNEKRGEENSEENKEEAAEVSSSPSHQQDSPNWQLIKGYHAGGYARLPSTLLDYMQALETEIDIPLDPVYTAKLFWGIEQEAKQGLFEKGSRVVVVHTGGLQGRRGYPQL